MFKKAQIRLTVLNALIFFILLNVFGAVIYFYTQNKLSREADLTIMDMYHHLNEDHDDLRKLLQSDRIEKNKLIYIVWNDDELLSVIPDFRMDEETASRFKPGRDIGGMKTLKVNGTKYRYMSIKVRVTKHGRTSSYRTIQIVYDFSREQEMLKHLMGVIIGGSLVSIVLALIAGYYLAKRSLIPVREALERQQKFTGDASHELRTPLSVIKLNLEHLFRHPARTIEEESETIAQAMQEINYMSKMTRDLLTLARADAGYAEINKEIVNLSDLLSRSAETFQPLAEMKEIELTHSESKDLKVIGDPERLKQLLMILLDNAIKYTGKKGRVSVDLAKDNSRVIIRISDTGIGISEKDLDHVFDRYYRGDQSRNRGQEGTGLGLSIASWIVKVHDGKINIKSKEGEGTTVELTFPIKKESA